ncbi:MAG: hypothetical protein QHJ73_19120, partial [Armatimonadota bacterium]|nr:hypothetical protein [Armatimonadota bacterium]
PDGTYSGIAFVDNRGVRVVLALYALTGNQRYLQSALRWGEVTMARQRPDGGYRMGYGITSAGESCFVADGGEIAIAIARLALDAPPRQRARYRASLARYMAFRESFRCPEGGIGVGYSQTDFSVRPTVRLDEVRRIYAPELNPYTIGCSLASASAHAVLFGTAVERVQAIRDARWLLAHLGDAPSGATIESLCWAHHLLPDASLRADIESELRERLLARLCGSSSAWWLGSDGRHALNLDGLVYALHTFAPEPAVRAEAARAVYAFAAEGSPWSVYSLRREPEWRMADWIFLCYAGVGLADAVRPGITLPRSINQKEDQ